MFVTQKQVVNARQRFMPVSTSLHGTQTEGKVPAGGSAPGFFLLDFHIHTCTHMHTHTRLCVYVRLSVCNSVFMCHL